MSHPAITGGSSNQNSMTDNGGADTGLAPNGRGSETGYRRLEGKINTFRAEFETLGAQAEDDEGTDDWFERAQELLDLADAALADGNLEQGWYYFHAANRLSIGGIEAVGGSDAVRGKGRELLEEARNAPLGWRADAVRERLAKPNGTLREDLTAIDLQSAQQLLHEGYEGIHRKRHHLQSQFRYLRIGALVTIVAFLLVAIASGTWGSIPSPFFAFESADSASSTIKEPTKGVGFLLYIVLSGMLGASLFGLRSLRRQSVSTSTPQYLSGFQATVARLVVGGGSALAVFFFVRSELLTIGTGGELTQGPFLVAVAFAAGYSQRFVHTTVEAVAGMAEAESSAEG